MWGGDFTIQPSKLNLGKAATRRHPALKPPVTPCPPNDRRGNTLNTNNRLSCGEKVQKRVAAPPGTAERHRMLQCNTHTLRLCGERFLLSPVRGAP